MSLPHQTMRLQALPQAKAPQKMERPP